MNEITAAVVLAQLERVDFLVDRRKKVASLYEKSLESCDWIIPQHTPLIISTAGGHLLCDILVKRNLISLGKIFGPNIKETVVMAYGGSLTVDEPVMIDRPF